jgi:hypothetical protein
MGGASSGLALALGGGGVRAEGGGLMNESTFKLLLASTAGVLLSKTIFERVPTLFLIA